MWKEHSTVVSITVIMLSTESWHVDKRLVQGQEKAQKNRPTQWGEEQQLAAGRLKNTQGLAQVCR